MTRRRTNPDYLNGIPELLVLRLLETRPMHGYELVQAIRQHTQAALEFGEGCIYPVLHRLESEGLLQSRRSEVAGRSRVVYRLAPAGKRRLSESIATWNRVVEAVRRVLEPQADAPCLTA